MKKIHLGLIFGGRSAEHAVSLQSARNILTALDPQKYQVSLIGIARDGQWYLNEASQLLVSQTHPQLLRLNQADQALVLRPGSEGAQLLKVSSQQSLAPLDVVFPVLHGTYGEDGAVQGLLRMAGIPFVGSDILGSAVGMDKDVMKRLLREAGLPTPRFITCTRRQSEAEVLAQTEALGYPVFVKPANLGSSVGIHKVKSAADLASALADAFLYDHKVLIEEGLDCREIECAVLGNPGAELQVSVPGEVKVNAEFYSYEAKYMDPEGASLQIPADLSEALTQQIQALARQTFTVLNAAGLARIDFFLTPDQQLYVNEINTLPGFTQISMYPKLFAASGLAYADLLDRLIQLALERDQQQRSLKTDF